MSFNSIGDLASNLMLSQSSLQAKRNILKLSQELTTGVTSDTAGALRNDYSNQMSWERSISSAQVREKTLSEAMTRIQSKQSVLDFIGETTQTLANDISLTLAAGANTSLSIVTLSAQNGLSQVLSHLNTQTAGRTLFAGSQTSGLAVAPAADILTSVKTALSGATTASEVISGVEAWMNDASNGFSAEAYLGGSDDTAAIRIGNSQLLEEGTRADHPALKVAIQSLILGSIIEDSNLGLSRESKKAVLQTASDKMRSAEGQITELQASLGYVESEVEKGITQAGAEISTAELLRATTLNVDQYEAATKLQEAQLQLEKIYTLTARSSQMSLLEYL